MSVTKFSLESTLDPADVFDVLTDFGPNRVEKWPSIDAAHFTVHELGDTWAEVTEGTDAAWERERYEWDPIARRVSITTLDSKLFGAGGGWTFQLTPTETGTRIDVQLVRTPSSFKGKVLASLLPLIGPSSLRKSFSAPLQAA
ncbi:SRPBCC family protein [Rathayibacter sp. CAU 1779]